VTDLRANGDISKFIDFARNGKVWERDTVCRRLAAAIFSQILVKRGGQQVNH
jgi:hypothetical protein